MELTANYGITEPIGFKTAGVWAGLKKARKDVCVIYSETPAATAGVFTKNKVVAAPVIIDKQQLSKNKYFSAIVVNSGSANACTGEQGMKDGWDTIDFTAKLLNIKPEEVLVCSTGVIGKNLLMDNLFKGISECVKNLSKENHMDAAESIMTTDTFSKELSLKINIDGKEVTFGAMGKGSGMIKPNMATMLGYITTDANIDPELLQESLYRAVNKSFNRISVDNDTSTNDTVFLMANGMSNSAKILKGTKNYDIFYQGLEKICIDLAKTIVKDGEGATKFVEVNVINAATEDKAMLVARAIADSYLVKTAIHGEDANWGRVVAAAGYSGADIQPEKIRLKYNELPILEPGYKVVFSEEDAKKVLAQKEIKIQVDLQEGTEQVSIYTTDLSKDYVAINANYRS
jgi:glutamate N-acetyltransferase / amino-acid N-acetyltransferase